MCEVYKGRDRLLGPTVTQKDSNYSGNICIILILLATHKFKKVAHKVQQILVMEMLYLWFCTACRMRHVLFIGSIYFRFYESKWISRFEIIIEKVSF